VRGLTLRGVAHCTQVSANAGLYSDWLNVFIFCALMQLFNVIIFSSFSAVVMAIDNANGKDTRAQRMPTQKKNLA
jgi:hypothetical protein